MKKEQLALLKTMERVILKIRLEANHGEKNGLSPENAIMLADLTDAIHNIPSALVSEKFDLNFHTNIMLGGFEQKYKDKDCIQPLTVYEHILKNEI